MDRGDGETHCSDRRGGGPRGAGHPGDYSLGGNTRMTRATINFGIDLGTTNSAIAVLHDGTPHPLRNNEQSEITPSAVMVDKTGIITVGKRAYDRAELYPDRVAREFKRAMGTEATFTLGGQTWIPEQLSAEVLKALCADAMNRLGEE